jgi:hypothetical protein
LVQKICSLSTCASCFTFWKYTCLFFTALQRPRTFAMIWFTYINTLAKNLNLWFIGDKHYQVTYCNEITRVWKLRTLNVFQFRFLKLSWLFPVFYQNHTSRKLPHQPTDASQFSLFGFAASLFLHGRFWEWRKKDTEVLITLVQYLGEKEAKNESWGLHVRYYARFRV